MAIEDATYKTIDLTSYEEQPIYRYDDVMLSVVKDINTRILNQSFTKLVDNDVGIYPINNYVPNVWECRWYNDDSVAGYSKGDVIWKGVMTFNEFLENYQDAIVNYANGNPELNGYLKEGVDYTTQWKKLLNVVSGYSVDTGNIIDGKHEYKQILPPLFDPGSLKYYEDGEVPEEETISIYISMKNDNKQLPSDSRAWNMVALTSDSSFSAYVSTEIALMMDEHVMNYHLEGATKEQDFNDVLLKNDFSNFDKDQLYGSLQIRSHQQYFNSQGIDYVVKFGKAPMPWSLSSTYSLYRWYRLWNSGYLEHGGFVEFTDPLSVNQQKSYLSTYVASVDLQWSYGGISAIGYDYPTVKNDIYGDMHKILYFREGIEQDLSSDDRVLGVDKRYSVSLTPVDFLSSYILDSTGKYDDLSAISSESFLVPQKSNNINFPYLNTEIHQIKNNSFFVTRSLIDDNMLNSRHVSLMQYYVSGYKSSVTRIYNISQCTVVGLNEVYPYNDGVQIRPTPSLRSNDGITLTEGIDYFVEYGENKEIGVDTGSITFIGYDPWRGSLEKRFSIKHSILNGEVVGMHSAYLYI